jgi:protein O-GlcNAc transferase
MPSPTSLPSPICEVTITPGLGLEPLKRALETAQTAVRTLRNDPQSVGVEQVRQTLRDLAGHVAGLNRRQAQNPLITELRALALEVAATGLHEPLSSTSDLKLATTHSEKGWPGLLAAMLLTSATHWPDTPSLTDVPDWLWGDYTSWIFTTPRSSQPVPALLQHLEDLHRWLERNPGSSAVRAASEAWLRTGARVLEGGSPRQQRRYAELRGLILSRLLMVKDNFVELPAYGRFGRRLRVGFVNDQFSADVSTYQLLANFEHLDSSAFEVSLFALNETVSATERYCQTKAERFVTLASDLPTQLETLRQAELDVLVFGGDLSGEVNDLTRLALHRIAPVQMADHRSGVSTGLPQIDLYLSGAPSASPDRPECFTERLGVLRGPARTFAISAATSNVPDLSREALELPDDIPLFGTVVTRATISAATLGLWARVLAAAPQARLLVALATDDNESFCARIESVFEAHSVSTGRVSLFPADETAPEDIRGLLRVADVYLNFGDANRPHWMIEALAAGRPVIARREAAPAKALLESLALDELLADTADAYVCIAARLANEAAVRTALAERLATEIGTGTAGCFDTLAASEAFAALVEAAFDDVCTSGRDAFRAIPTPFTAGGADAPAEALTRATTALERGDNATASAESLLALRADPTNLQARIVRGRALVGEGRAGFAVPYLLAAVQQNSDDAVLWFTLATALRADGKTSDAIKALETSLRLDGNSVEGWLMLHELAEAVGASDIAEEARTILHQLAPGDPRISFQTPNR